MSAATALARITAGFAVPNTQPKFALDPSDTFFCIGSCFARNIEEHLIYRALTVSSRAVRSTRNERGMRPNGFVNKFTTGSVLNEIRWSIAGVALPSEPFVEGEDGWSDLQLAPNVLPSTLDRARERRAEVGAYFARLGCASVVVVTLGLVEAWYDVAGGVILNSAPSPWAVRRSPGRFVLKVTDYQENLANLKEIRELLVRFGKPGVRIVLTVSPVPLSQTFTGDDVITANMYSKSTLRAVADDFAAAHADVQYFPAYESVVVSHRSRAFEPSDELHVQDQAVDAVVQSFLMTYGLDRERPFPEFAELPYLRANPDVHDAIRDGRFGSGYEHWIGSGRSEGRPLAPSP